MRGRFSCLRRNFQKLPVYEKISLAILCDELVTNIVTPMGTYGANRRKSYTKPNRWEENNFPEANKQLPASEWISLMSFYPHYF